MRGERVRVFASSWLIPACLCIGCSRGTAPAPLVPQTSGTVSIAGLFAPVRVLRDRFGVPHIYADSAHDLFMAQGFVQAEDRLFQIDLWKRASEGRLSQVLGPNFIERDAMTRRFQYGGDLRAEWDSYGPDTEAIAQAFVAGVNAWVELARARPTEEFVAAGWKPEYWTASDLLSRTDAFLESGDAAAEAARKQMNAVVVEAIRRVGTAPFFVALGGRVVSAGEAALADPPANEWREDRPQSGPVGEAREGVVTFADEAHAFDEPSRRYLVHLHAPGWNVAGVTRPWLPGVAAGHNERIAWAPVPVPSDTQDVHEDAAAPHRIAREAIVVKGRRMPFVFDVEQTSHGLVVASDRARGVVFTVRWSGTEPGAASELAALAIDRATSWEAFRAAAARWKMPVVRLVYADVSGLAGFQNAGLTPVRKGDDWVGWPSSDDLPHSISHGGLSSGAVGLPPAGSTSGRRVVFASVLGVTAAARRRFDAGPFEAPRPDNPVRLEMPVGKWDAGRATNAPGQVESPASAYRVSGAKPWSNGQWQPIVFSDDAVRAAARETLILVPKRPPT